MKQRTGTGLFRNIMVLFGVLGFATSLVAVTGPIQAASKDGKYGIINMQAVILNVDEGKKARAELEKDMKAKSAEFDKRRKELEKLNDSWKEQAALLSESARLKRQQDFQEKFLALRSDEAAYQQEIKRKEQQATQRIAMNVQRIVSKMAKDRKLEAVFETNTSGLLYLENPVDLTQDVIDVYGKASTKTAKNDASSKEKSSSQKGEKK